ncbi:MAG TPA: family 16 glycoside hydrolase [Acidobacteriota bacterium]|nr:family 16 glycoside hydrolase [Acidobacteriota bacterium]
MGKGKEMWKKDSYNQILVSIKGQPPLIKVNLNGKDVVEFQDESKDGEFRVPEEGFIGVQVHPGESWGQGNRIYFREIWIKPLLEK